MNRSLYLIIAILLFNSCSKDVDITLTVSQQSLSFIPEGNEQSITVTSNGDWFCTNTAGWLLVRQQQGKIRIIAEPNNTTSPRTDVIKVMIGTDTMAEIKVTQNGGTQKEQQSTLSIDKTSVNAKSVGETFSITVNGSSSWIIKNDNDWCQTAQQSNSLSLIVDRNYGMQERKGSVTVVSGNDSCTIAISQAACEWYESFEMAEVIGGSFLMGAQKDSIYKQNYNASAHLIESPVHEVTLPTYSIGKYEVTQAQWKAAMQNDSSAIQNENYPISNVTWHQVQEFIEILNEKTGLTYRLPTEAEWEYAAKGGNSSQNYTFSGNDVLGSCGWYYSNSSSSVHSVGTKAPNELGIYDMSGNVREWCSDWFDYYTNTTADNPQGPKKGIMKITRGGSWTSPATNCRNTFRHTNRPNEAVQDLGFRLVLAKE